MKIRGVELYEKGEKIEDMFLRNKKIGISVSDPEWRQLGGLAAIQQRDISGKLVKHLLLNGTHVVYGGDLREDGYTYRFSGVVSEDHTLKAYGRYFTNYLAWPFHQHMRPADELFFALNGIKIIKAGPPADLPPLNPGAAPADKRYYAAYGLSAMRREMAAHCDVRVCTGGNLTGYAGFYPGVIEEAFLSLRHGQPLYILGTFGGASQLLIRAIRGEDPHALYESIIKQHPSLTELYDRSAEEKPGEKLEEMLTAFSSLGMEGLATLNGLSVKENETLFNARQINEIMYHIFQGIKRSLQ